MNACRSLLLIAILSASGVCMAQEAGSPQYKLTAGVYRYRDDTGHDLNLRWQQADTHLWLGAYQDRSFGSQWRTGVDRSWALLPWLSIQPSLQWATGGFVGGSATLQAGDPWYGVLGWGRTNLKPYFNLNFDPNDAYTVGVGWRGEGDRNLSATLVADDRLHTGQKHWHLNGRWPIPNGDRLTLDVLRKSGQGDNGHVQAWGWSVAYDWPHWFVRVARDPQQNFADQDALRLAVGRRW